jgi:hypothetical protein
VGGEEVLTTMTADVSAGRGYVPDPLDRTGLFGSRPSFGERRPVVVTVLTMSCLVVLGLFVGFGVGRVMVLVVRAVLDVVSAMSLSG